MRFQYDKGKICVISAVYEKNKTELASKNIINDWKNAKQLTSDIA